MNLDGIKNLKYPYFLLKSLGINFSMVVDMDFLTQYKNDSLKNSRNSTTHLPEYKNTINMRNLVINDIWSTFESKQNVTDALNQSYSKTFELCKTKNILPMQFCLEMDLVANSESKAIYCSIMGISNDDDSSRKLLIDNSESIKDPEKIMTIIEQLQPSKYPYSYKRIRKALADDIKTSF